VLVGSYGKCRCGQPHPFWESCRSRPKTSHYGKTITPLGFRPLSMSSIASARFSSGYV
jgi:hypothetical protein